MAEPALIYEKRGHIVYITLNRPEKRNAINPEMMVRRRPGRTSMRTPRRASPSSRAPVTRPSAPAPTWPA